GAPAGERLPPGRRAKISSGIPVRAQLIVLFALGGIAKNLIGLVDFLEFFFGLLFVLCDIGVVLAGEFAKSFLNLRITGSAGNTEYFVIVFVLNRHSTMTRRPPFPIRSCPGVRICQSLNREEGAR